MMDALIQDLRYALRSLRKSPAFTAMAVITLALGVGPNTAIYTMVDAMLLRRLPFPHPEQLAALHGTFPRNGRTDQPLSYPNFRDWQNQQTSFSAMAVYSWPAFNFGSGAEAEQVNGLLVTSGFFSVLGVSPQMGRDFRPEEDHPNAERVAIVSYEFWQRRLSGAPEMVGRTIQLDGRPVTVIGVMPRGFIYSSPISVWMPLATDEKESPRGTRSFDAIGRLKPGVLLEAARAEAEAIGERLAGQYPESNFGRGHTVIALRDDLLGKDSQLALVVMFCAVGLVLLIAAANVANLVLARAVSRQRDLAVKTALGASRGRIVRQLLLENGLLGLAAGTLGTGLAVWGTAIIRVLVRDAIPSWVDLQVNGSVLAFTAAAAILAGVASGAVPGLQLVLQSTEQGLRESGRGGTGSLGRRRLRAVLIGGEMALSVLLLVAATLMLRTFRNLRSIDPGFDAAGVLAFEVTPTGPRYDLASSRTEYLRRALERLHGLPGVRDAGMVHLVPLDGSNSSGSFSIDGFQPARGEEPRAEYRIISGDYFRTAGIQILRGRTFTEEENWDSAARVVVVSQSIAGRYWPGEDPLGKRLHLGSSPAPFATIVGVVRDVKEVRLPASPLDVQLYLPYRARPTANAAFLVRTTGNPEALSGPIRDAMLAIDPTIPPFNFKSLETVVSSATGSQRATGILLLSFAAWRSGSPWWDSSGSSPTWSHSGIGRLVCGLPSAPPGKRWCGLS